MYEKEEKYRVNKQADKASPHSTQQPRQNPSSANS
jgi:hypothetical protein